MSQTLIASRLRPPDAVAQLTPREQEVLRELAIGLNNAEIATLLYVSSATVKNHVANILAKLELRNRVQAAVFAWEHGLVA